MTTKYERHLHAMQSGVATEMGVRSEPTEPKHLRVGINAAMADHCGLVQLLMAKGVITEAEYVDAITESMAQEHIRYEGHLSKLFGREIKLG